MLTIDLDLGPGLLSDLVDDVLFRVGDYSVPDVPGLQTRDTLQDSDRVCWREFHQRLRLAAEQLIPDEGGGETRIRSRGVVFNTPGDFRPGRWWVHTHHPARLSSVVTLQRPTQLTLDWGGTVLRSPWAALDRALGQPTDWSWSAGPSEGIIFPGPIEHWPEIPNGALEFDRPRVIVVTDFVLW